MTSKYWHFAAATAAAGLSLFACGAEDETAFVDEELAAADSIGQQPAGVEKIFEDQYSEGGALAVYESPVGLTVMVTGRTGADDPRAAPSNGALTEVYRALHPESNRVPAEIDQLSARLEAERARAPRDELDAATAPALVPKSQSFFDSTVCQDFYDFPEDRMYLWRNCFYRFDVQGVWVDGVDAGDRVYTLNDGAGTTRTQLQFPNGGPTGDASLWLSPGQWGFGTWGGTFEDYQAIATFHDVARGDIGITHHDGMPIIR